MRAQAPSRHPAQDAEVRHIGSAQASVGGNGATDAAALAAGELRHFRQPITHHHQLRNSGVSSTVGFDQAA
jgi:hypothetical protein